MLSRGFVELCNMHPFTVFLLITIYNPLLIKLSVTTRNFILLSYIIIFYKYWQNGHLLGFISCSSYFSFVLWCLMCYLRWGFVPVPDFIHNYSWRGQYSPYGVFVKIFFPQKSCKSPLGILVYCSFFFGKYPCLLLQSAFITSLALIAFI